MKLLTSAFIAIGLGLFAFSGLSAQRSPLSRAQIQPVNMGAAINAAGRDSEPTFGSPTAARCTSTVQTARRMVETTSVRRRSSAVSGLGPRSSPAPISTEYSEVEPLLSPAREPTLHHEQSTWGYGSVDIWVSDKVDGEWTEPRNLGAPINSPYADHCLYFTGPDGSVAYWTSTRPGGYGGNDIWRRRGWTASGRRP